MWKPTTSSQELMHSAKGTTWGKHKYIAIKNGRYIYPEDLAAKSANASQNKGLRRTQVEVKRQNAKKTAAREQEAGRARTIKESSAQIRRDEKRVFKALDSAAREQEKGRNKTAALRPKLIKGPTGFSKTAAKFREQANIAAGGKSIKVGQTKAFSSGGYEESETKKSRDYMKKAEMANSIYKQGQTAANNDRRNTGKYGGMARFNPEGKAPKNKTARKNQRRAAVEKTIYKTKSKARKALKSAKATISNLKKKLNEPPKTRITVTSNLMPAGTKKDITNKYNHTTSKKKKRG